MHIQPIRSDDDHSAALKLIDELWGAAPETLGGERLEILVTLVDAYERENHEIGLPEPVAAILFRMDQLGLTRKDIEPYIGTRGRVSEVLSGKRDLTLAMIRRLRDGLGIPADVLIGRHEEESAA